MLEIDIAGTETLERLVDAVEHGEQVTLIRNGRRVATLVAASASDDHARSRSADAMNRIRQIAEQHTIGTGLTVRDLINDDRR